MRIACLFDIHANLPALEAVLTEVENARVDEIVIGGDIFPGPMPRQTLERLLALTRPTHFLHGNGDLAVLAQLEARRTGAVKYWGTTSGRIPSEAIQAAYKWDAQQVGDYEDLLASWPETITLEVDGLGKVLFCHGTPRSETEIFTRLTPEAALRPLFDGVHAAVVVCGHTHMQFDRPIGMKRVLNAGSVGEPFGDRGAFWLMLGPGVDFRRTTYDTAGAGAQIRLTDYPLADELASGILAPALESEMLELYGKAEVK